MLKKSFLSVLMTAAAFLFLSPSLALAQRGGGHGGSGGGHSYSGGSHSYSGGSHSFNGGGRSYSGGGRSYSGGSRGYYGGGRSYSAPAYRGHDYDRGHYRGYYGPSYRGYYASPYYYSPGFSFGFGYGYDCVPAGYYDAAGFWHPYAGCASYPPY